MPDTFKLSADGKNVTYTISVHEEESRGGNPQLKQRAPLVGGAKSDGSGWGAYREITDADSGNVHKLFGTITLGMVPVGGPVTPAPAADRIAELEAKLARLEALSAPTSTLPAVKRGRPVGSRNKLVVVK